MGWSLLTQTPCSEVLSGIDRTGAGSVPAEDYETAYTSASVLPCSA